MLRGIISQTILILVFFATNIFSNQFNTIVSIKDYNYDTVNDTLIGSYHNHTLRVDLILWGLDSVVQGFPLGFPRVDTTHFIYPEWERMRTYTNISSFNTDTISDIMIMMSGRIEIDSQFVDTTLKVIIYGQHGLDSVPVINLNLIQYPLHFNPFKAKHIITMQDFTNCQYRSYDFSKTSEFIKSPTFYPPPIIAGNQSEINQRMVGNTILYPNPTHTEINLNTKKYEAGQYIVEIYSVNSELMLQEKIHIAKESENYYFDISRLPNGMYMLVISRQNQISEIIKFIKNK